MTYYQNDNIITSTRTYYQNDNNKNDMKTEDYIMKKTLVVVDMQNDFIDGALGSKEAVAIVDNVKKKIAMYKENGDEIILDELPNTEKFCVEFSVTDKNGNTYPCLSKVNMEKGEKVTFQMEGDFETGFNLKILSKQEDDL